MRNQGKQVQSNICKANLLIRANQTELMLATPSNIYKASLPIRSNLPIRANLRELMLETPSNICKANLLISANQRQLMLTT